MPDDIHSTDHRSAAPTPDSGLIPHIVCAGAADAMVFYAAAFDAVELFRLPAPDGRLMHASLRIGPSTLMLVDEMPEWQCLGPKALGGTGVTLHRFVPDVDAAMAQAERAGAKVVMPAADQFWGDRYGIVEDPWGHRWSLATHVHSVSPDEMATAMTKTCPD